MDTALIVAATPLTALLIVLARHPLPGLRDAADLVRAAAPDGAQPW
jgi:hypothetical protein